MTDHPTILYRLIRSSPLALTEAELIARSGLRAPTVREALTVLAANRLVERVLVARGTTLGDAHGWHVGPLCRRLMP